VRLKRRKATSKGSFSFTRMVVIDNNFQNVLTKYLKKIGLQNRAAVLRGVGESTFRLSPPNTKL